MIHLIPEGCTPGPWEWRYPHTDAYLCSSHSGGQHILNTDMNNAGFVSLAFRDQHGYMATPDGIDGGLCSHPDAKLIAAAPDMYEALVNVENDNGKMCPTAWEMIQDAVEKAGGVRKP